MARSLTLLLLVCLQGCSHAQQRPGLVIHRDTPSNLHHNQSPIHNLHPAYRSPIRNLLMRRTKTNIRRLDAQLTARELNRFGQVVEVRNGQLVEVPQVFPPVIYEYPQVRMVHPQLRAVTPQLRRMVAFQEEVPIVAEEPPPAPRAEIRARTGRSAFRQAIRQSDIGAFKKLTIRLGMLIPGVRAAVDEYIVDLAEENQIPLSDPDAQLEEGQWALILELLIEALPEIIKVIELIVRLLAEASVHMPSTTVYAQCTGATPLHLAA